MAHDKVIGIDLGTTNSLVAYMEPGPTLSAPDATGRGVFIIPGEEGSNLVPSVVALERDGRIRVGNAARDVLLHSPERAIYSVKRLMGRGVEDIQEELKLFPFRLADDLVPGEVLRIRLGERTYTPPEISAQVLRQLKRGADINTDRQRLLVAVEQVIQLAPVPIRQQARLERSARHEPQAVLDRHAVGSEALN